MKRKSLNKCAILFAAACLLCLAPRLYASQKDIIDSARAHIRAGEYYNAITETMRYQHLYPAGLYHPESLLIMAEAYYRGGNIFESAGIMSQCYNKYRNKPEGEKALFLLGHIRLVSGSTYFAFRTYQEYNYIYKNGAYSEAVSADTCRALALLDDFESAMSSMETHLKKYPEGEYTGNLAELRKLLDDEASRPRKKMWLSVLGSIFIPGFGHFYTEKYSTGAFSLGMNAALIYLIYDGVRDRDKFRIILFSILEFSFYQYSLFSALGNVREYNSRESFYDNVRLGIKKRF